MTRVTEEDQGTSYSESSYNNRVVTTVTTLQQAIKGAAGEVGLQRWG